jgi:tetratricopeptide (TPR) repeat protein
MSDDYSEQEVASARAAKRRWPWSASRQDDLEALSMSIELYPDNPTSYLLRGEHFEAQRQFHLAAVDYQQALALAQEDVQTARWGLIAQVVQDRAMMGLRRVTNSE